MRIRKMREADIPAVVEFEKDIFPDPWTKIAFEDTLDYENGGGYVVETSSGEDSGKTGGIIAYACYYSAAGETHLTNIAVAEGYRRKGVAKRLLDAIFAEARESSSAAVFLEVRESSSGAQLLYEKNGFNELYRRKSYYSKPTEDAIVYVRELQVGD
jgi:[ribosomal protein S18]-alanine N-acetyltransferase